MFFRLIINVQHGVRLFIDDLTLFYSCTAYIAGILGLASFWFALWRIGMDTVVRILPALILGFCITLVYGGGTGR